MVTHSITEDFINYVTDKAEIYNPRGRSADKVRMDIECEHHEYTMIKEGLWTPSDDWRIDGFSPWPVDVKFLSKWYNLTPTKICNIFQQRNVLDGYLFMEWVKRPRRPLKEGDEITYRQVGYLSYDELVDNIRPSTNYKDWGTSHYVNVRGLLKAKV